MIKEEQTINHAQAIEITNILTGPPKPTKRSKVMNQQIPPLPKRKRVDSSGNDHRRLIVKSGNATLIIASGLTKNACEVLESNIKNSIKNLGGKCECTFKIIM